MSEARPRHHRKKASRVSGETTRTLKDVWPADRVAPLTRLAICLIGFRGLASLDHRGGGGESWWMAGGRVAIRVCTADAAHHNAGWRCVRKTGVGNEAGEVIDEQRCCSLNHLPSVPLGRLLRQLPARCDVRCQSASCLVGAGIAHALPHHPAKPAPPN